MELYQIYRCFKQSTCVATDTRNCMEGAFFFALKGANFNGNAFAATALEQGCAYAVVDDPTYYDAANPRMIWADDSLKMLQDLARFHRQQLGTKIVAVTGTNGKTTTKELIAAVLKERFKVLYTQGNLNNHIGVPLTLLQLTDQHELAVIEMGASHPGEIQTLVNIAEPDYGLITNVGKAHLEGFGSLEGVIRTKGELYDYLRTKPEGTIFLHNDNIYLKAISSGLNCIRYGSPSETDFLAVSGEVTACDPYLSYHWRKGNGEWQEVQTQLIGSYNIDNALAATAIGLYFGIYPEQIQHALTSYQPLNHRSQLVQTPLNTLVVDAYNANPTSMQAALDNFERMEGAQKMVILGDMKELGDGSVEEHQKVVDRLEQSSFQQVWLVGPEFAKTRHTLRWFADVEEVKATLQNEKPTDYLILIKGSNSMKLASLAQAF